MLYYDYIVDHISIKLQFLAIWSNTRLALDANYDVKDIAGMITPIKKLIESMEKYQGKSKRDTSDYQIRDFEELEKQLVTNVKKSGYVQIKIIHEDRRS